MDYMAPLPTTELSVQGLFSGLRVGFLGSKVLCLNRQTDVEASPFAPFVSSRARDHDEPRVMSHEMPGLLPK